MLDADAMRPGEVSARPPILRWSRFETFAGVLGNTASERSAGRWGRRAERSPAEPRSKLAGAGAFAWPAWRGAHLYLDLPNFTAGRMQLVGEDVDHASRAERRGGRDRRRRTRSNRSALALDAEAIVVATAPAAPPLEEHARRRSAMPGRAGGARLSILRAPGDVSHARRRAPPPPTPAAQGALGVGARADAARWRLDRRVRRSSSAAAALDLGTVIAAYR